MASLPPKHLATVVPWRCLGFTVLQFRVKGLGFRASFKEVKCKYHTMGL